MQQAAQEFMADYRAGTLRWLTYYGSSGTGKTFLSSQVIQRLGGRVQSWPRFMAKMRTGDFRVYESVDNLATFIRPLLLDEIGVGNDAKTFGLDLLLQVFDMRRSLPTIVTTNLTMAGLADIDARLASRLMRYGKVIECNTTDYSLR